MTPTNRLTLNIRQQRTEKDDFLLTYNANNIGCYMNMTHSKRIRFRGII
jgi:hypothetical protein